MTYFYYNSLLQSSDQLDESQDPLYNSDLNNFRESLDKKHGYQFNILVNILNNESIQYKVIEGFNYNSKDQQICNFEKISFVFKKAKDIDSVIGKYRLDDIFNINKDKKNYTFIIK